MKEDKDISLDILIVFAAEDDQPVEAGQKGWVSNFHKFFSTLLSQIAKSQPSIRLVPSAELKPADLDKAIATIAIVSNHFAADTAAINNIGGWAQSLESKGELNVDGVSRFLKVVKSPCEVDNIFPEFADIISYDFFFVDAHTGKMEEFRRFFGSDAEKGFWMKLVDIAYDMSHLLSGGGDAKKKEEKKVERDKTVYLAGTGMDLLIQRDVIKRELKSHGYEVLPDRSLPKRAADLEASVREDLAKCRMSIHLIGEDYGYRPEGSEKSVVDIQNSIASDHTMAMSKYNKEHNNEKPFSRLIWLSPDLKNVTERQKIFIEDIKSGAAMVEEAEVLQIQLQELKSIIHEELVTGGRFNIRREIKGYDDRDEAGTKVVYLITDKNDLDKSEVLQKFLTRQGFKVLAPSYEGELVDIRYIHQENLRRCDGSIIYYGDTTYEWIKTKQQDLLKAPGFGRDKPLKAKAIYIDGPKDIDTTPFEKNKTLVLGNSGKFEPETLAPFITKLND